MSESHLSRMKALFESRLFFDITFLVGENKEGPSQNISAHRDILGSASPIFARMFNEDFNQNNKEEIHVPDVVPSAFNSMLKWIYTDEIELDYKNVIPILYCAKKYEFTPLRETCETFIYKKVKSKNLCEIFHQARRHEISELQPWIENWISLDPLGSLTSSSFLQIKDNNVIKEILSNDQLDLDEIKIFDVALCWASDQKKNDTNGEKSLREILGPALYSIRFPLLTRSEFLKNVMFSGLLNDEEIGGIVKYIYKTKTTGPTDFSTELRQRRCVRFETKVAQHLVTLSHAICFKVDKPINIHGLGIFPPSDPDSRLTGAIQLSSLSPKERMNLGDNTFNISSNSVYASFVEPISITPNVKYVAVIVFDQSSLNINTFSGKKGVQNQTVNGVQFKFKDYFKSGNGSNIKKGNVPFISFRRIHR